MNHRDTESAEGVEMADEPDYEDPAVFLEHIQRAYGDQARQVLREAVDDVLDLHTMADLLTTALTANELAEFFAD